MNPPQRFSVPPNSQSLLVKEFYQAVLQGLPFTGVQVLRSKRLILLHGRRVRRTAHMQENCAPLCAAP